MRPWLSSWLIALSGCAAGVVVALATGNDSALLLLAGAGAALATFRQIWLTR